MVYLRFTSCITSVQVISYISESLSLFEDLHMQSSGQIETQRFDKVNNIIGYIPVDQVYLHIEHATSTCACILP